MAQPRRHPNGACLRVVTRSPYLYPFKITLPPHLSSSLDLSPPSSSRAYSTNSASISDPSFEEHRLLYLVHQP